jgi:hypothetical protein
MLCSFKLFRLDYKLIGRREKRPKKKANLCPRSFQSEIKVAAPMVFPED